MTDVSATPNKLIRATLTGAVAATVANGVLFTVAKAAGVPFLLPDPQDPAAPRSVMPIIFVLGSSFAPALAAGALMAILVRVTRAPARVFLAIAAVVLAASFIPSVLIDADTPTRVVLALLHVVAAAAIAAPLARAASR